MNSVPIIYKYHLQTPHNNIYYFLCYISRILSRKIALMYAITILKKKKVILPCQATCKLPVWCLNQLFTESFHYCTKFPTIIEGKDCH